MQRLSFLHRLLAMGMAVALLPFAVDYIASAVTAQSGGLLPDLQTVVPGNLVVGAKGSTVLLRFNNVIANLGTGRFQVRPETIGTTTVAYQQILNASDQVVAEFPVSTFEFHPGHDHWHIDAVANYELRAGSLNGTIISQQTKVTFCLIDTEKIVPKGQGGTQHYTGCNEGLQGITNGWADEYVNGLPGQEIPITGVAAGIYYLISTADSLGRFAESNENNNEAWVKFALSYVNGTPKISELETSPCEGVMCGVRNGPRTP